jgi:hypothetical protein
VRLPAGFGLLGAVPINAHTSRVCRLAGLYIPAPKSPPITSWDRKAPIFAGQARKPPGCQRVIGQPSQATEGAVRAIRRNPNKCLYFKGLSKQMSRAFRKE